LIARAGRRNIAVIRAAMHARSGHRRQAATTRRARLSSRIDGAATLPETT
jgi:hypothetical protein